jgi:hypothetical protein
MLVGASLRYSQTSLERVQENIVLKITIPPVICKCSESGLTVYRVVRKNKG